MTMQMRTSEQPSLKLLKQRFSTLSSSDLIESVMIHAYLVSKHFSQLLSSVGSALNGHIGLVGNVGTERQIAVFF
jgi:hypothetical protein